MSNLGCLGHMQEILAAMREGTEPPPEEVPVGHSGLGAAYAVDLGYHWPTPRYEGQSSYECGVLPAGRCFYDGSGLNAVPVLRRFLSDGPSAVWKRLDSDYRRLQESNDAE